MSKDALIAAIAAWALTVALICVAWMFDMVEAVEEQEDLPVEHYVIDTELLHTGHAVNEIVDDVNEDVEDFENELIEEALFQRANKIENCTITAYCSCSKCCGKWSDGITASGVKLTPGVTVAVDTNVISLGSDVIIEWADGSLQYCRASDTGSGVKGNHIDLAFDSHQAAL